MKGKVYKIICTQSDDVYIGSTFNNLRKRLYGHRTQYNTGRNYSLTPYFDKYGKDNFKIILIKEYEVIDNTHLEAYEQLWINKTKCINKNNTLNLNFINRAQYLDKRHNYYKENKDTKIKEYLEKTKEKRLLQGKEYREKMMDKIKQVIICECGGKYNGYNNAKKVRHLESKKHKKHLIHLTKV